MKCVTSVTKTYKHRGNHHHRSKTKKYWYIIGYDYDDFEETWNMFCEQVSWIKAMYHKCNKYKKLKAICPNCRLEHTFLVKKKKDLEKQKCSRCDENFKDLFREYAEENNLNPRF